MDKLKIEYLSTDELIPYANNPRNNDDAVDYVANSIREFGFKNPVIVDKDNTVVCGHTRLKAAKKLGIKEVPCIIADDLTEQQIDAFRLADNKVSEIATWDFDKLEMELESITDIDMPEFGFDDEFSNVSAEDYDTDFSLPDGDKPEICTMTFTLHQNQKSLIDYAMLQVENDITETFGNTNKNGNALYEVVRQWAERKKLK